MVFPIAAILGLGGQLIDRLIPDKKAQAEAKLKLIELEQTGELEKIKGQIQINLAEAQHKSVFVAGWRPAVGWICAAAFGYTFVAQPFIILLVQLSSVFFGFQPFDVSLLPVLDWGILSTALFGMLGIGAMRSYDKNQGTQTDSIKPKK